MNTLLRRAMLGTVVAGGLLGLGHAAASADATNVTTNPSAVVAAPTAVTTSPLTAVTAPVLTLNDGTNTVTITDPPIGQPNGVLQYIGTIGTWQLNNRWQLNQSINLQREFNNDRTNVDFRVGIGYRLW